MRPRRILIALVTMALGVTALGAAFPAQAQGVQVLVDGRAIPFDQPPVVRGGRVLVPLRGVFERLGALVEWDSAASLVRAVRAGRIVEVRVGSRQALVDGDLVLLDIPPLIVNGRTLVPLRFISEALGAQVDWDPAGRTVFITSAVGRPPAEPVRPLPRPLPPAPQPAPSPAVVEGTVVRVDAAATPPRLFVQRDAQIHVFLITPESAITRVDVGTQRGGAVALEEVRPGDFVRVTADAAGRAITVRVQVREVTGRLEALTVRAVVLSDGQAFTLAEEVRFLLNGRPVAREELRAGMVVTLRLHPQTQQVTEVAAQGGGGIVPGRPPVGAIRIEAFTHSAQRPLRAGETLTVTLRGTPGGTATFDIFGVAADLPMREIAPGVYQGTYVVRPGDNVANAGVFGRLRVGGQEGPLVQAGVLVTLDTIPPAVHDRYPPSGATVANVRPNILITYSDPGGAGVDPRATRLIVNGQDVTAQAAVTETAVAYTPPAALAGVVTVRLHLADRAGNVAEDRYRFRIGAEAGASLIRSVTVHPGTPLQPGDTLTVMMTGQPGGQASFSVEGLAAAVPMVEATNAPGTYVGAWAVPAVREPRTVRILVRLTHQGRTSTAEASVRLLLVAGEVPPPAILAPSAGSTVGAPIVVRGRTLPGYQVVVRIDYSAQVLLVAMRGSYGEVTTTADAAGRWQVTIQPTVRIRGARLTIVARAVDPAGTASEATEVQVIQG